MPYGGDSIGSVRKVAFCEFLGLARRKLDLRLASKWLAVKVDPQRRRGVPATGLSDTMENDVTGRNRTGSHSEVITPLWKVPTVARILGLCNSQVYRMADRGQLPCVRWECPGNGTEKPRTTLRFEPERIRAWIEKHRVEGHGKR